MGNLTGIGDFLKCWYQNWMMNNKVLKPIIYHRMNHIINRRII